MKDTVLDGVRHGFRWCPQVMKRVEAVSDKVLGRILR
jgi:hypothetical protein